jgi:hypothetical protein
LIKAEDDYKVLQWNLHMPGQWELIWNHKVPPMIKNLVWRVCRGCFPTKAQLNSRGVSCLTDCVVCRDNYEDIIHFLMECPHVTTQVNRHICRKRLIMHYYNMNVVIFTLLHQLQVSQSELFPSFGAFVKIGTWNFETGAQIFKRATCLLE